MFWKGMGGCPIVTYFMMMKVLNNGHGRV